MTLPNCYNVTEWKTSVCKAVKQQSKAKWELENVEMEKEWIEWDWQWYSGLDRICRVSLHFTLSKNRFKHGKKVLNVAYSTILLMLAKACSN